MKSIRQIPISHPTKPFLDAQLEEARIILANLSFAVKYCDWGKEDEETIWKLAIPVPNHMDSAWQTIVYELRTVADFEEAVKLYEDICLKLGK